MLLKTTLFSIMGSPPCPQLCIMGTYLGLQLYIMRTSNHLAATSDGNPCTNPEYKLMFIGTMMFFLLRDSVAPKYISWDGNRTHSYSGMPNHWDAIGFTGRISGP